MVVITTLGRDQVIVPPTFWELNGTFHSSISKKNLQPSLSANPYPGIKIFCFPSFEMLMWALLTDQNHKLNYRVYTREGPR